MTICLNAELHFFHLPVILLPSAEMHHALSEPTDPSQEECFSTVSQASVRASLSLVPTPEPDMNAQGS